ncbi:acyl-CoA hydrolase [Thioflavicoccus mobilis 8321]|uniref:Acyl-CoA hydrolase n=2 Tax=Thioflavicoccus mobilis TaxID=80679 RepID=L0GUC9_9GAMM|nr:acyl-CoA thioesterase [Thioflavicoccus mobilis]AGA90378.1 acyl-CoA hydrolase [Thioflavicoccus mobilis 8321]
MNRPPISETLDPRQWHLAIRVTTMPADTNAYGDIFGGWLMSQADIAGSTVAIQVAQGRIATVAVKEFRFVAPVLVGDLVNLYARLVRVGRSSITVEVEAWAQREPDPTSTHRVATATFTYVAVSPDGRPRPVNIAGTTEL